MSKDAGSAWEQIEGPAIIFGCFIGFFLICHILNLLSTQTRVKKAKACRDQKHELTKETAVQLQEVSMDRYMLGWTCNMCNETNTEMERPFDYCELCEVNFCVTCAGVPDLKLGGEAWSAQVVDGLGDGCTSLSLGLRVSLGFSTCTKVEAPNYQLAKLRKKDKKIG
jgi:hypothetical protein